MKSENEIPRAAVAAGGNSPVEEAAAYPPGDVIQLSETPMWVLERMQLPRGGFSPEERAAAQREIKRRFGLPPVKPAAAAVTPEPSATYRPRQGWFINADAPANELPTITATVPASKPHRQLVNNVRPKRERRSR